MENSKSIARQEILNSQFGFFSDLFNKHGDTPQGVSSESSAHKNLRYEILANPIFREIESKVSVHDVGMGVGTFLEYLKRNFSEDMFEYSGSEIVKEYVEYSRLKFPNIDIKLGDIVTNDFGNEYDWLILSGVFHQRLNVDDTSWLKYFSETIIAAFELSKKGIAFNVVSPFVDYKLPNIYYADLKQIMELITSRLTRFFTIQHAYPLYECTFHVYKSESIAREFNEIEFKKYFKRFS